MEIFQNLYLGFSVSLLPTNLFLCFAGVFFGTIVGILPGLGAPTAVALLLPTTFSMSPESALIMMAGIYYGAQYGGSTTAILLNIPGEASSVVTCLDGYQMARKGKAGRALGISAFGSFIGGTLSVVGLMLVGTFVARFALRFGPPEYFGLTFMSLVMLNFLAKGSRVKSLISILAGLFIGTIGIDYTSGVPRFNFGTVTLLKGIDLVPVAIGLFGIGEVLTNIENLTERDIFKAKIKGLLPTRKDWKDSIGPIGRGSLLGFLCGIIPGGGSIIASFVSYIVEKRVSRHPETFGTGAIQGVAGPETANNAATGGAMIPLLSLGIPTNSIMALLLGAMMIHGIKPGPFLIREYPQAFWGVVTSMYTGNVILLILNLPLIGLWVKMLKIPYRILFPLILLFCLIGAYGIDNDVYDVLIMLICGGVGYLMRKTGFDPLPLVFALIICPIMENNFRISLLSSRGHFGIFFTHPISAVLIGISFLLLLVPLLPEARKQRERVVKETSDD